MAAAAATTAASLFSSTLTLNPNPKPKFSAAASALNSPISHSTLNHFLKPQPSPSLFYLARKSLSPLRPCSAVQDMAAVEEEEEEEEEKKDETLELEEEEVEEEEKRRKLFVVNLPWSFSAPDVEKLFGECGTVKDVEIIKQKNGKSRGFAFITMASGDEARAVVKKFDSFELSGRIIRVEFAKNFRKPSPPLPLGVLPKIEGRYKIYASNLAWKVRATNLRDFVSEKFKPISARVVFDSPTGRSAGYGFVGFATMEEAEAAVSELDGKELMGRPLRLKISQRTDDESGEETEEADDSEQQSQES